MESMLVELASGLCPKKFERTGGAGGVDTLEPLPCSEAKKKLKRYSFNHKRLKMQVHNQKGRKVLVEALLLGQQYTEFVPHTKNVEEKIAEE